MPPAVRRVETLAWVALYGGLLSIVLGLSLFQSGNAVLGHVFLWGGAVSAVAGVALVWWRSRMDDGSPPPRGRAR